MSSYRRYRRARRAQDPVYRQWRRNDALDLLIAAGVIVGAFVLVLSLVFLVPLDG